MVSRISAIVVLASALFSVEAQRPKASTFVPTTKVAATQAAAAATSPAKTSTTSSSSSVAAGRARPTANTIKSSSSSSTSSSSSSSASPSVYIPKNVPPKGPVYDYGNSQSNTFANLYRDGGGGITINGINLMVFSDSYITAGNTTDTLQQFVANTFAYCPPLSGTGPITFRDFSNNGYLVTEVPVTSSDTPVVSGGRNAIWPSQSLIESTNAQGQPVAVAIMPVIQNAKYGDIKYLYSTLVEVTVGQNGPSATRIVPKLFDASEPTYGNFGLTKGMDGYTYLFANDATGLKAARVPSSPASAIYSRSNYQYYNGVSWTSSIPTTGAAANFFSFTYDFFGTQIGPGSGEIFWSSYHNTYLLIFMDSSVSALFRVSYSLTGQILGPYTDPVNLYQTGRIGPNQSISYGGHSYPGMDPSGNTLALSYTYNGNYINMAKITWCNPTDPSCTNTVSGFLGYQGPAY